MPSRLPSPTVIDLTGDGGDSDSAQSPGAALPSLETGAERTSLCAVVNDSPTVDGASLGTNSGAHPPKNDLQANSALLDAAAESRCFFGGSDVLGC